MKLTCSDGYFLFSFGVRFFNSVLVSQFLIPANLVIGVGDCN
jgi:hypothetical protein